MIKNNKNTENEYIRKQYNPILDNNIQNIVVKVIDVNLHKGMIDFYS